MRKSLPSTIGTRLSRSSESIYLCRVSAALGSSAHVQCVALRDQFFRNHSSAFRTALYSASYVDCMVIYGLSRVMVLHRGRSISLPLFLPRSPHRSRNLVKCCAAALGPPPSFATKRASRYALVNVLGLLYLRLYALSSTFEVRVQENRDGTRYTTAEDAGGAPGGQGA